MKTINIFWWNGQHWSNLIERWIFNTFEHDIIEQTDNFPKIVWNTAIIVWITQTEQLINKILKIRPENTDLINFSGIMSTTPEHIRGKNWISNFHFLFWPKANQNLKVVFAWDLSETSKKIIENTKKLWINIIETDIETHDSKMAITQAMTHLFILLSGLSDNSEKIKLITEWNTPNNTIIDMIFENKLFKPILSEFLNNFSEWWNLSEIFLDTVSKKLNQTDIENFWTPTFNRISTFANTNNIFINDNILQFQSNLSWNKNTVLEKIAELKGVK